MNIVERIKNWSNSRGVSNQKIPNNDWVVAYNVLAKTHVELKTANVSGYLLNKVEEAIEYAEAMRDNDENGAVDAIADSTIYDLTELVKMGYDIKLTLNEVLLIIESRTGEWCYELGKFVKDKSPKAKARWYHANYVKNCKANKHKTQPLDFTEYREET